jgi:elongation factor Ts
MTGDCIVPYIHAGYKMGVLVGLNKDKNDAVYAIGRDVAMQIAAMNPVAIDADSVAPEAIEREKNIIMDTMKADPKMEGKPEEMLAKIAEGKIGAFFKENTLLNQAFVKDGSKSVAQVLKEVAADLTVTSFKRVTLGTNA